MESQTIFLSMASDDFRQFRPLLAEILERSGTRVDYQERFENSAEDTVIKLANKIVHPVRGVCDLVIHVIGHSPGSVPGKSEIANYFNHFGNRDTFLQNEPELRNAIGDLSDVTYTQWEALLAIEHGIDMLVYADSAIPTDQDIRIPTNCDHPCSSNQHLSRLLLAKTKQYAAGFHALDKLSSEIVADVKAHFDKKSPKASRVTFAEPQNHWWSTYTEHVVAEARRTPGRSIVETELDLLNQALTGASTIPSPIRSRERPLSLEFRRLLLLGDSQVAKDLRRMFPWEDFDQTVYVSRRIDHHFAKFLSQSDRPIFAFANRSGAGKTTFLVHAANRLSLEGHIVLYLSGSDLKLATETGNRCLHDCLNRTRYTQQIDATAKKFVFETDEYTTDVSLNLRKLQLYARSAGRQVYVVVDALDRYQEYETGSLGRLLTEFLNELFDSQSYQGTLRVLLSCRSEIWDREQLASIFVRQGGAFRERTYLSDSMDEGLQMEVGSATLESESETLHSALMTEDLDIEDGWFTRQTYHTAFLRYQHQYSLNFENVQAFAEINYPLLREPLMLRMFFEKTTGAHPIKSEQLKRWQILREYVVYKRIDIRKAVSRFSPILTSNDFGFVDQLNDFISAVILFISVEMLCDGSNSMSRDDLEEKVHYWMHRTLQGQFSPRVLDDSLPKSLQGAQGKRFFSAIQNLNLDFAALVKILIDAGLETDLLALESDRVRFTLDIYFEFCLGRAIGNAVLNQRISPATILSAFLNNPRRCISDDAGSSTEQSLDTDETGDLRNLVARQFLWNAIRFAVLQTEQTAATKGQSSLYSQTLAYLASNGETLQKLACEIICELAVLDPTYTKKAGSARARFWIDRVSDRQQFVRKQIKAIFENCLNPISDYGDFVCRFALRQALIAIRRANPEYVDNLLNSWLSVNDSAQLKSVSTADHLRTIAAIDALGQSDEPGDFESLIECVEIPINPSDTETRFWIRRIAATSMVQFVKRHRNALSDLQFEKLRQMLIEAIADSRTLMERAMLSEQFVYCIAASKQIVANEIISLVDQALSWQKISLLLALINIHNELVAQVQSNNSAALSQFQAVVGEINRRGIFESDSSLHQSILNTLKDGFSKIEAQPEQRLTEDELFCSRSAAPATTSPQKIPVYFSPEFFSTYYNNHHECKERVYTLLDRFELINENNEHLKGTIEYIEPQRLDEQWLTHADSRYGLPIHDKVYVEKVKSLSKQLEIAGSTRDQFQYLQVNIRPGSWGSALRSAGAVADAVDAALSNNSGLAICANRPPGHLATNQICIFNNVALGVRHAQRALKKPRGPIPKITVLDIDAHHGLHLQKCFYADDRVAYVSIHQQNIHPGEGFVWQIGFDRLPENTPYFGTGSTLNFPVPENADIHYCEQFVQTELTEHFNLHQPEMIFIACGADADWRDPFAGLCFEPSCFYEYGKAVRAVGVPVVVAFEGGFGITNSGIADSFEALIEGLTGHQVLTPRLRDARPIDSQSSRKSSVKTRSIVCQRTVREFDDVDLILHGDVQEILDSAVSKDRIERRILEKHVFGLGAGMIASSSGTISLDGIGEALQIGNTGFVQCPITKSLKRGVELQTPFFVGFNQWPQFWQRIRTWQPLSLKKCLANVNRSFDYPVEILGIVGVLRTAPGSVPLEKRLSLAPTTLNRQRFENRYTNTSLPFVLSDGLIEEYFDSGIGGLETHSNDLIIAGLIHRNFPNLDNSYSQATLNRFFYDSPLANQESEPFSHHIHFALLRPHSQNCLWSNANMRQETFLETLTQLSESTILISHLEDALIEDAYIGIVPITGLND
jgi:acetoin utilization deacetylase AcuC-like enzyme